MIRLDDIDIYTVGRSANLSRDLSIIVFYDILGFNVSQTRVFCDRLAAEYNVHVIMPDFFRGRAASIHISNLTAWLAEVGNWSRISADLKNVASWLRTTSPVNRIAIIGFCWGGLQVVRATSNLANLFFTGLSIHGAWLTADEVKNLQQPVLFVAAGNDPPLVPDLKKVIEESTSLRVSSQCEYKTYRDMRHGFVSGGANYSNPANVAAIDSVHETVKRFLDKMTRNSSSTISFSFLFMSLLLLHPNVRYF